jgi:hypothetical protein
VQDLREAAGGVREQLLIGKQQLVAGMALVEIQ